MTEQCILVFTDLDGTLLDHHDYSYAAAEPALHRLKQAGIPVILNSSKTRPEMEALRARLGNQAPFIVENGAAAIIPAGNLGNTAEEVVSFAAPLDTVLHQLHLLRAEGFSFCGFSDMSVEDVVAATGLSAEGAANARQRIGTEPLLWLDDEAKLPQMRARLEQAGLQLIKGGRFYHAMGQYDKADAMQYLIRRYQALSPYKAVVSIALGDSPNDIRMLESADYAVVVNGINANLLTITGASHVLRSRGEGPVGWNECIQSLLNQLLR